MGARAQREPSLVVGCRSCGEGAAVGAPAQHRPPVATVVSVAGPGSPAFTRRPVRVAKELLNPSLGSRNTGPNKKVGLNGAQRWHGRPHGDALRLGSTERRSTHRDAPVLQLPGAAVATSRRARASSPRSGGRHIELRPCCSSTERRSPHRDAPVLHLHGAAPAGPPDVSHPSERSKNVAER